MLPEYLKTHKYYLDEEYSERMPEVVVLRMSYMFMINYNYLVIDRVNNQSVIIDPAWDMDKIEQAIMSNRVSLNGILLTHAHPDHTHLAKPLAAKHNCPIWMSHEEIAISGYNAPQLTGIDTTPWPVGQLLVQPIFTPGHTSGSLCYLIGDNLFTGDTLFAEGCGICDSTQDAHSMFASNGALKKGYLTPENKKFYPGHSYGKHQAN
ncbi:MAG: MBL fold metallo-hydrolase, partial [Bacteroidales bacterium]|nr:MBL fold metallo-hydrolase [Bacteroidales bacterium]